MKWIIDCSFSSALFLPGKHSKKVSDFFNELSPKVELIVPGLWWYELSNVLIVSVNRGILPHRAIVEVLALFGQFVLNTIDLSSTRYAEEIYEMGQLYKLSAYDAAYLNLAISQHASLASLDKMLIKAAKKAGIETYPF